MRSRVYSEPGGIGAVVCGAIAGTAAWYFDLGTVGIVFYAFVGLMSWTVIQWMDMTTGRLMRIEEKLDDFEGKLDDLDGNASRISL